MKKIIIFLIFIFGCATANNPPIIQNNNLSKDNAIKIAQLKVEVKNIEKRLNEIDKKIEKLAEKVEKVQKNQKFSSDNKTKELILSKISELYAKQEDYLTYLTKINDEISDLKNKLLLANKKRQNKSVKKVKKVVKEKKPKDEQMYSKCYKFYKSSFYKKAIKCFNDFIKKYKKSKLIPNAYFWIGNSYFQQGIFLKAIDNYDVVLTNFPKSKKVPAALLKEGLAFYYMKDKEGAKIFLQKVINEYPATPQAYYAKKFMEKFNLK